MLASQRLDLEVREVRQALNNFPDDGEDSKRDELTAKYSTLESKYRAALITEDTTEAESTTETTAEGRDFGRLRARASISDFVLEVAGERDLEGASKEYRQAVLGDNIAHYMPLEMLARTGTRTPGGRGKQSVRHHRGANVHRPKGIPTVQHRLPGRIDAYGSRWRGVLPTVERWHFRRYSE